MLRQYTTALLPSWPHLAALWAVLRSSAVHAAAALLHARAVPMHSTNGAQHAVTAPGWLPHCCDCSHDQAGAAAGCEEAGHRVHAGPRSLASHVGVRLVQEAYNKG